MLIDEGKPALVEPPGFNGCEQSHPLDHIAGSAANINRLAAWTRRGCTLDDRYLEASTRKLGRERRTRDPGAADQN
jgi:hypothetical protein